MIPCQIADSDFTGVTLLNGGLDSGLGLGGGNPDAGPVRNVKSTSSVSSVVVFLSTPNLSIWPRPILLCRDAETCCAGSTDDDSWTSSTVGPLGICCV